MSQVTGPIVINNGAATPVSKSFLPMSVSTAESIFTERSAAFPQAYPRIVAAYSPANGGRKTHRIGLKVDLPVVELVAGVEVVTRTLRFDGSFIIPDTATSSSRADLCAFVTNALGNALVKGLIKDLDPLY